MWLQPKASLSTATARSAARLCYSQHGRSIRKKVIQPITGILSCDVVRQNILPRLGYHWRSSHLSANLSAHHKRNDAFHLLPLQVPAQQCPRDKVCVKNRAIFFQKLRHTPILPIRFLSHLAEGLLRYLPDSSVAQKDGFSRTAFGSWIPAVIRIILPFLHACSFEHSCRQSYTVGNNFHIQPARCC